MNQIPRLPARLKKNYLILAPESTHWRPATCAEVQCRAFTNGWDSVVDESTELGQAQAAYFRGQLEAPDGSRCGRRYVEVREPGAVLTTFRFAPFQKPFGTEHEGHRIRLEREAVFAVRDPQVNGGVPRLHDGAGGGAVNWTDDFAAHQDKLAARQKQG